MKFFTLLFILVIFITGCGNEKEVVNDVDTSEVIEEKEQYVDNNPIVIGIYEDDYKLVKDYSTLRENNKDLVFGVYYSNEEILDSKNQKYNWNKFYQEYDNIDNYKIGYQISFNVGDEKIQKTILGPDIYAFNPYFYIYLYDDINQADGTFYSHLEESDVNENTIFSSIKIYTVSIDSITSPIKLTAFTYDGDEDFDESGNYRGSSKYTVDINLN